MGKTSEMLIYGVREHNNNSISQTKKKHENTSWFHPAKAETFSFELLHPPLLQTSCRTNFGRDLLDSTKKNTLHLLALQKGLFCLRRHIFNFFFFRSTLTENHGRTNKIEYGKSKNTPAKYSFPIRLLRGCTSDFREVKSSFASRVSKSTGFKYFDKRLLKQPCTARTTKQVSRTSSPCSCDHVNTSSVDLPHALADLWPEEESKRLYHTYKPPNRYATPPQVMLTIPIYISWTT